MSSSQSRPRLSDRLKGKFGDDLVNEIRNSFDESRKKFFKSNPSWGGSSTDSPRRGFPFDDDTDDFHSRLDKLVEEHTDFPLGSWRDHKRGQDNFKRKTENDKEEEEKKEEPAPLKPNLRNTVPNMQQRREQEDLEDERNQRARSAPPDQKPFISKVDMKDEEQGEKREPVVRHIPIFVEGRDEPIIPKDEVDSRRQPTRERSPAPPDSKRMQKDWQQQKVNQQGERAIPISVVPPAPHGDRSVPISVPPSQGERSAPATAPAHEPQEEHKPMPSKPARLEPLEKVSAVQQEVTALMKQVEGYKGASRQDKDYIYLDEMLTRNLLKLDDIETEGKDDVRTARRETIRSIQRCISLLESKVPGATDSEATSPHEPSSPHPDPPQPTT